MNSPRELSHSSSGRTTNRNTATQPRTTKSTAPPKNISGSIESIHSAQSWGDRLAPSASRSPIGGMGNEKPVPPPPPPWASRASQQAKPRTNHLPMSNGRKQIWMARSTARLRGSM